jgi:L-arabinose isomerase
MMKDFANMLGIEFVHIGKDTTLESLEEKLLVADLIWKLR